MGGIPKTDFKETRKRQDREEFETVRYAYIPQKGSDIVPTQVSTLESMTKIIVVWSKFHKLCQSIRSSILPSILPSFHPPFLISTHPH